MEEKSKKIPIMREMIALDWKCSSCENPVADTDYFCSNCGNEFEVKPYG